VAAGYILLIRRTGSSVPSLLAVRPIRSGPLAPPKDIQVALFSATMPADVLELTTKFMRDPARILVKKEVYSTPSPFLPASRPQSVPVRLRGPVPA